MATTSRYPRVVFAGGGSRCLWQAGFWESAAPRLGLEPRNVAAVSAGGAIACLALTGGGRRALEHFCRATAANPRNFHARNLVRGRSPFPHHRMYRDVILHGIDDDALRRLHAGPDVRIVVARPPRWLGRRRAAMVAIGADVLDELVRGPVHPQLARRLGFRAVVESVRSCATPEALADLILASSCTPPVLPFRTHRGVVALDGAFVANPPISALPEVVDGEPAPETLVLLSRRTDARHIPRRPGTLYVQPSAPIDIARWDYSNPRGLRQAFDLGRRDGERFDPPAGPGPVDR